ncbi:transcriptional regulator domain-containing protein [Agrobacterium radiobacter]|uniref:transcriptional regulator domain-containing protein n=1 Tax=Agrobacterium radiobacter TaxID=362 RepID=UPI003F840566
MVPDTREWRISTQYDFMDEVDTNSLAWECLRRSARYQKDFLTSLGSEMQHPQETESIPSRWGLRFPCTTQPHRPGANRLLDA